MLERAALAILVHIGAPSSLAAAVAGLCWLSSLCCRPHWSMAEDSLDIFARLTMALTCLAACLIEAGAVSGSEVWLAVALNGAGGATLMALAVAVGPVRLVRGAVKWYREKRRASALRKGGPDAVEKMTEKDAAQMSEGEFAGFSIDIKIKLSEKFPAVPACARFRDGLASGSHKFNSADLKYAIGLWKSESPAEAERVFGGPMSGWDVSGVTDMKDLFQFISEFNEDISGWNVR